MMKEKRFGTFVVSVFLENCDFIVVSPPIYEVLRSFTKLIDKKKKTMPYTIKESLIYITTNVECAWKI